jgi:hypothetical protein
MSRGVREFLNGRTGKVVAIALALVALAAAVVIARDSFGPPRETRNSNDRMFICAETGKAFEYTIKRGDMFPVMSPHSGKKTGYEAEKCFWTADGKSKKEPTFVLLNEHVNKPGPTFCPDCGRHVVRFNPPPTQGAAPPPKQSEMKDRPPRPVED